MLKIFSDNEIDALIREPKAIPNGLVPLTKLIERSNHRRRDFEVRSDNDTGNEFVIAVRQSMLNSLDFSAILGYKVPGTNAVFRLRRYNGSHVHTNQIEGATLNDFHIHTATERYQVRGLKEDAFAQVATGHSSLETAIRALLEDCGFNPPALQAGLFGSAGSQ
jgi:hypothetical protein